jgi:uncharacterized LabA/DUF88 family protein
MASYAGFIDVEFLRNEGTRALALDLRRTRMRADAVVDWLQRLGSTLVDGQLVPPDAGLLRVYWYDAAFDTRDERYGDQRRYLDGIASTPRIQVRLGRLAERTPTWHEAVKRVIRELGWDLAAFEERFAFRAELVQKGVDTRLVMDLVRLAERAAYDCAVLVAGDGDLAEAVRAAQEAGRRVVVASPNGSGIASDLQYLADEVLAIAKEDLERMLEEREQREAPTLDNLRQHFEQRRS